MNGYMFQMALETKRIKSIIINIIMISLILIFFSMIVNLDFPHQLYRLHFEIL